MFRSGAVPFQWSRHRMDADGAVERLADGEGDPSEGIARPLVQALALTLVFLAVAAPGHNPTAGPNGSWEAVLCQFP